MPGATKRKAEALLDLQTARDRLQGLPNLTHAMLQQILKRLSNQVGSRRQDVLLKEQKQMLCTLQVPSTKDGRLIDIPMVQLDRLVQAKCRACPSFGDLLSQAILQAGTAGMHAVLYVDEAVPGNVLRPDNHRRSYLVYVTWMNLQRACTSEFAWCTIASIRQTLLNQIQGGLPAVIAALLDKLAEPFEGFAVEGSAGPQLLRTTLVSLLADEPALKCSVSAKSHAGMRPCLRCRNALAIRHGERAGFVDISSHNFEAFLPQTKQQVCEYMRLLSGLKTKGKLEESQKLLGWIYNPSSIVCRQSCPLTVERCMYDAMHCLWCNGIVGLEISLFLRAARDSIGFKLSQLAALGDLPWKAGVDSAQAAPLLHAKLLSFAEDYKGDSKQTMALLPLLVYYARTVLQPAGVPADAVQSLTLLCLVCMQVKLLKLEACPASCSRLLDLQQQHLEGFKSCYTREKVRPKHHFSLHLAEQAQAMRRMLDCFVTERKNKTFKQQALSICNWDTFESSVLLRLLKADVEAAVAYSLEPCLRPPIQTDARLQQQLGCSAVQVSSALLVKGGELTKGFYVLTADLALHVDGFLQRDRTKFLALARTLSRTDPAVDPQTCTHSKWSFNASAPVLADINDICNICRPCWSLAEGECVTLLH